MNEFLLTRLRYYVDGRILEGSIHVRDSSIVALYPVDAALPADVQRLDCSGKLAIPGLVNAHTHSHNILARGTLGASSLEVLIGNIDAANKDRTPEEAYAAAALNAIECVRGGSTALVDMFTTYPLSREHIDAVAEAYVDVGVRALIAPHFTDLSSQAHLPGFVESLPPDLRARIERDLAATEVDLRIPAEASQKWNHACEGRITFGLAPTVPHQCSDQLLEDTGRLAAELGIPIHTHLAESRTETVSSQTRFSGAFVARLIDFGILGEGDSAAHAIWLGRRDLGRLAEAGSVLVHCPSSNLRLGAGVARVNEWERAGVAWTLGSDGAVSSDNLNMLETIKCAGLSSRIWSHDTSTWLKAEQLLERAFAGSTRTLGSSHDLSGIRPGAQADFTLFDTRSTYLAPGLDLVAQLVYSETGASVSDVIVAGKFVLEEGRITTIDEESAIEQVKLAGQAMIARNAEAWALAEQLRPYYNAVNTRTAQMPWRPADDAEPDWSESDLILPF
ncbi:5-methylthioadenosine/S-adenosylhomocysteine deaminase [Micromonospora qiuiae]|uniref:5-methylthioadenosine/S-adenosylhomocysteine deaminase n=1 Tax=Micromonospora qiuiae TaxID=502268 RepID=A0ABQ4JLT6_9ACTN|nr:amidohydrolase family protein [Micromonospora qiuiae]GIJ30537.1 5-methylthioadenosine/S-adenosylhomocysteine deaminase [Micromonospora qiuiae]